MSRRNNFWKAQRTSAQKLLLQCGDTVLYFSYVRTIGSRREQSRV